MALTFKKGAEASIGGKLKVVQYEVANTGSTHAATIEASDIGLSTILQLTGNTTGEATGMGTIVYTVALGTFTDGKGDNNYATVQCHNLGTTRVNGGTFQIFAIGM